MEPKKITIIIPHYVRNDDSDLEKCILSIERILPPDVTVIVVVNGGVISSHLHSFLTSKSFVKPLFFDSVMTSYSARNIGIMKANSAIVVFIDSDVTIDKDFFVSLNEDFKDPNLMMSGGRVEFSGESKVSFITANLAVRKEVLDRTMFNEMMNSGGDIEFANRVILLGYKVGYSYNRVVFHKPEGFKIRFMKSLRYGSGTTAKKLCYSWSSHFKSFGLLFAKTVGFMYYCMTDKMIGKR